MDRIVRMDIMSSPQYAGTLQLDVRPMAQTPAAPANEYSPSPISFPAQRSPPKGPRPAPSTASSGQVQPAAIQPAEPTTSVIKTDEDVDALQHHLANALYYGEVEEAFGVEDSTRNLPETLPAALFCTYGVGFGSSASPPPFARDARRVSSSSAGSSQHHRSLFNALSNSSSLHAAAGNSVANATVQTSAPDPWVERGLIERHTKTDQDPISGGGYQQTNPISLIDDTDIQSALEPEPGERSMLLGHFGTSAPNQKLPYTSNGGADLGSKSAGRDSREHQTWSERVTFAAPVRKAVAHGEKEGVVDPPRGVPEEIKQAADDNDDDEDPIPSPNSPQDVETNTCARSSLFESLVPPPFSTATSVPASNSINSKKSAMASNSSLSLNPARSIVVGSHDSARIHNHFLAESTTWEKVEGINDEWQELSNPREEVLAMSESEDSEPENVDEDDDDDEEWEASRKSASNTGMADSAFLPSVERRRRLAAAAHLKNQDAGAATPRGKRTPTTSFARAKNTPPQTTSCSYEAYNSTTAPPPGRGARPAQITAAASNLTPQQMQLVAELQRARNTHGGDSMAARRAVPVSSDW